MNRKRLIQITLVLAGLCEVLAFIAVVMPREWMEISHAWIGMGEMPQGKLLMFMIRQASYAYGMHGVSLLILATNVVCFRPLIVFNGIAFLLAAPVFFLIDYPLGMPWWWTVSDAVGCGFVGVALLLLTRGMKDAPRDL